MPDTRTRNWIWQYSRVALLLIAAEKCDYLLVRDILQINPELVQITDKYGNTPLAKAAWKNSWECVHFLLVYGSDPDQRNQFGYTPKMHACKAHNEYVHNILLTSESVYGNPIPRHATYEDSSCVPREIIQPIDGHFIYLRTFGNFDRPTLDRLRALDDPYLTASILDTYNRVVCYNGNNFHGDICTLRQATKSSG